MPTVAPPATGIISTDALVIGAGPVGLFQVFQLGLQGLQAHVIDALPQLGGQCAQLYGDKAIYDIPALPSCSGHELVQRLVEQCAPFAPQWHLGELVSSLSKQADGRLEVITAQGTKLVARTVFIAAGVGAFMPRPLQLAGLEAFAGQQVFYSLDDTDRLTGQHVLIHGGGEAAVSQALECASLPAAQRPASITLQHRRDAFEAPAEMLAHLQTLRQSGEVQVVIGQITGLESQAGLLTGLSLLAPDGSTQRVGLDVLLVRLGLLPRLGPVADWGLALERKQLQVDTATFATNAPGIYAVGDIITYPGKRKLLVCGFHEATLAAFAAAEYLAGHTLALEYTSSSRRLQQRLGVQETPRP
ncbi:NAD(P)/FAD-dependent oxidoreductase [Giesbergeria anulus]|uniref:Ferredoxin--NADP reductase n=1 Tax=Giesbergeria anulus TaxID=180197 RepID=A0A1H9EVS8_9BURK|nr:NAD(P)/FAD-dependent oxidoreductase [Giesbergeria anulus]SEQ29719.1 thioredoxin reductase (NADPH) [Giesbergeria anulus]